MANDLTQAFVKRTKSQPKEEGCNIATIQTMIFSQYIKLCSLDKYLCAGQIFGYCKLLLLIVQDKPRWKDRNVVLQNMGTVPNWKSSYNVRPLTIY